MQTSSGLNSLPACLPAPAPACLSMSVPLYHISYSYAHELFEADRIMAAARSTQHRSKKQTKTEQLPEKKRPVRTVDHIVSRLETITEEREVYVGNRF